MISYIRKRKTYTNRQKKNTFTRFIVTTIYNIGRRFRYGVVYDGFSEVDIHSKFEKKSHLTKSPYFVRCLFVCKRMKRFVSNIRLAYSSSPKSTPTPRRTAAIISEPTEHAHSIYYMRFARTVHDAWIRTFYHFGRRSPDRRACIGVNPYNNNNNYGWDAAVCRRPCAIRLMMLSRGRPVRAVYIYNNDHKTRGLYILYTAL